MQQWQIRGPNSQALGKAIKGPSGKIQHCHFGWVWSGTLLACLWAVPLAAIAEDEPMCMDYYAVGESDCRPVASTPVEEAKAQTQEESPANTKQAQKSEVDEYLENYGKPPREFIEFYMNPAQENATRWVSTYREMLQRGKDLSRAWQEADQLYQSQEATSSGLATPKSSQPAAALVEPVSPARLQANRSEGKTVAPVGSIGAFSQVSTTGGAELGGVRSANMSLVYYFSQTCPFCARMTPDLAEIVKETKFKLVFTCVDVTPLGVKTGPDKAFITAKLPCEWRLPEEGEIESQNVAQTPTLLIRKEGMPEVRLSGYVPLAQLRQYF